MNIPCIRYLPFLVYGLGFLQPAFTRIQFENLTLIATALVLGSPFCLSEISRLWLKEKSVSTLSHFLSDAKFSTSQMHHLYALRVLHSYKITRGYFIIDDTLLHRSNFCKWIHGVFVLFDHALKTNLRAICIVVLYYSNGCEKKCALDFRIYYQESCKLPWGRHKKFVCKPKYMLGIEMLKDILLQGYPGCVVLADSWFGTGPFIKELRKLGLSYIIEIRSNLNVRIPCAEPKLTTKGKLSQKQYDLAPLPKFFESIGDIVKCGFTCDEERGKKTKVLYHAKTANVRLNSISGKHRVIESFCPSKKTIKYLLTNELTWEATKIIKEYSYRWAIEELFRNAKQLLDMEGATVRNEQGITVTLYLVFCIDFLFHSENCKHSAAGELPKEPQTIPSIVRQLRYENIKAFIERVQNDREFVQKWLQIEEKNIYRKRKKHYNLIKIHDFDDLESVVGF